MSDKGNKEQQGQEHSHGQQKPSCHKDIKRPLVYPVRIEPSAEDNQKYGEQKDFWRRQLRIAKALNGITAAAAAVGLFGLFYLHGQLRYMQQQLSHARAVQIARLTVEMPRPTIKKEPDGATFAQGSIVIRNVGDTPALDPAIKYGFGGSIVMPKGKQSIDIAPNPSNFPISASSPIEIPYGTLMGYDQALRTNRWYAIFDVQVAYKDVFGTTYAFSERFFYDPRRGTFYRRQ